MYLLGTTQLENENLQFGGTQLSVNALSDISVGCSLKSCRPRAIQVHGLPKNTSTDMVQLFFENKRTCDGGDTEQLDFDAEEGIAVVVYKDADSEYMKYVYMHMFG